MGAWKVEEGRDCAEVDMMDIRSSESRAETEPFEDALRRPVARRKRPVMAAETTDVREFEERMELAVLAPFTRNLGSMTVPDTFRDSMKEVR
jgi:hypothetical protein